MTTRDILFHLDVGASASSTRDFAVSLAAASKAHLTAAGVVIEWFPPTPTPGLGLRVGAGADIEACVAIVEQNRKAVMQAYERLVAELPKGSGTELVIIEAAKDAIAGNFGRLARHFDLSVVAQGTPEGGRCDRLLVSAALFGSGRPVFVVPYIYTGPAKLGKAMICWDGGVQASRALAGALPLLTLSESVEVVCFKRAGAVRAETPDIRRHLARHGISASLRDLPASDDVGASVLSYAADSGADYLVMGAYGHWRVSELILGGTTRTILSSMTVPVLMAH